MEELDITVGRTVGRANILRRLRAALLSRPVTMVILGEAGIGKTHLLTETKNSARENGIRVLEGRARDFGGGLAYASLSEALGSLRGDPEAWPLLRDLFDAID